MSHGAIQKIKVASFFGTRCIYISTRLLPELNISTIPQKGNQTTIHVFLQILRRTGLPADHLLHYYTAVICPVLEYCSCIWHHNISTKLAPQIGNIQKRAIKIIFLKSPEVAYAVF